MLLTTFVLVVTLSIRPPLGRRSVPSSRGTDHSLKLLASSTLLNYEALDSAVTAQALKNQEEPHGQA